MIIRLAADQALEKICKIAGFNEDVVQAACSSGYCARAKLRSIFHRKK